ncbi:MAG: hypothetical protein RB191_03545 [Terriglobia bacterium]|nr:hypothetical protein [Terriglobia bacterium]
MSLPNWRKSIAQIKFSTSNIIFNFLEHVLTSAVIEKRTLRLAGMLMHEGIDVHADERVREVLIARLHELRNGYAADPIAWDKMVMEGGQIDVDVAAVSIGAMNVTGRRVTKLTLSEENIDQLFDEAGRRLAAGEGLHRTYWKRFQDRERPNIAKLELFAVMRHEEALGTMEKLANVEFDKLWAANKSEIKKLAASKHALFLCLVQASRTAAAHDWELPLQIVEKTAPQVWKNHIFADSKGDFATALNTWEEPFLDWAMKQDGFVCWLRNLPRRDWALCVPYDHGGEKPFYPDFIIVRTKGQGYEFDILEPHDDSRTDTWAKVRGLAAFADKHGLDFGRMVVGRKKDGVLQIVDVSNDKIRAKARAMGAPADLEALFEAG